MTSITELATQNSWVNYGSPYNNAGYYIDKNGIVHLVGLVKSGVQTLATPITEPVPAGYRSLTNKVFTVGNPLNASILVTSAGQILTYAVGNSDWLSLEGVGWAAEQ